jgi:transposase
MQSTCTGVCSAADVICRTVELGVVITGASIDGADRTIISARPVSSEGFCPCCGAQGVLRDHVDRELVDIPMAGHVTRLVVRVPRYRCVHDQCEQKIFTQRLACAEPGAKTTRRCTRWILQRLAIDKMSIAAIARQVGLGWDLVNQLALSTVREIVYDTPGFLDGVRLLGVDEHTWRHTRTGVENSVTVLIDLTPAVEGTGPARLLDMRQGRSAKVLAEWLGERSAAFRSESRSSRWTDSPDTAAPPGKSCPTRPR